MTDSVQDSAEVAWQAISLFAAEEKIQMASISRTPLVFFEDCDLTPGENYVIGVYLVLVSTWGQFYDENHLTQSSALPELKELLDLLYWFPQKAIWTTRALQEQAIWKLVRRTAQRVLDETGLPRHDLNHRINIENWLDPAYSGGGTVPKM